MDGNITESARDAMLRGAVAQVEASEVRTALTVMSEQVQQLPKAMGNALAALRRQKDPVTSALRPQYRSMLPFVAAAISDHCLARTIEVLGEHADEPTAEQLSEALVTVRDEFPDVIVAVMLASVSAGEMPASDICFDLLASDERYGLTESVEVNTVGDIVLRSDGEDLPQAGALSGGVGKTGATEEVREARRLRRQQESAERRRREEAARRASEQVRQAKKQDRLAASEQVAKDEPESPAAFVHRVVAPDARRATLPGTLAERFDLDHPWVTAIVLGWIPFVDDNGDVAAEDGFDGKVRPCVVVAVSDTHLLVRPGYSQGGVKSRDWRAVPLAHWRRAGLDQPTWIDLDLFEVERDEETKPVGWISVLDWNALW